MRKQGPDVLRIRRDHRAHRAARELAPAVVERKRELRSDGGIDRLRAHGRGGAAILNGERPRNVYAMMRMRAAEAVRRTDGAAESAVRIRNGRKASPRRCGLA